MRPALIPRRDFFDNPQRSMPRLAPDGRRIAFLAPSEEGILNLWVRDLEGDGERQVSEDRSHGVRQYCWAEDDRHLLYLQDSAGDENWQLHAVDLETGRTRGLTPFDGVRADGLITERTRPDEILVGLNRRDPRAFDVHRIELSTGRCRLDTLNPGHVHSWIADHELRVRAAMAQDPDDAATLLLVRTDEESPWRELVRWPFGEIGYALSFTGDGKRLLVTSSLDSDTTRLVELDATTGECVAVHGHDTRCDVGPILLHPESRAPQALCFEYMRRVWSVVDDALADDFDRLARAQDGDFALRSRDREDQRWIVEYDSDRAPRSYVLYERESQRTRELFVDRPALAGAPLAATEALLVPTRDGAELTAYLTRPRDATGPTPLVLLVHGGPWARDHWGFHAETLWLADRGYAVLRVNFRASTGFGKAFVNAGNGQWGTGIMQHDLTDAVRWAVAERIADPRRVGIYGSSYGGYATLAGLAFTPELYACGVDRVGPANLRTLLSSIPEYWAPMKRQLTRRVGEVESDEALNRRISPCFHAESVRAPLLIAQGENDPRVKVQEAEQMVEALRTQGTDVLYVLYTDEGHGCTRPANRLDFFGRAETFLAAHLGGRAETFAEEPGASAELR